MSCSLFDRYNGRSIFRLYLGTEGATALAVTPAPNGRVFIDTDLPQIDAITIKAGWFIVEAGASALQQFYINPEHVVAVVWASDEDLPDDAIPGASQ